MTLGALVDLGVDVELLSAALEGLKLPNWSIKADIERRMGLRGVNVQVFVDGQRRFCRFYQLGLITSRTYRRSRR